MSRDGYHQLYVEKGLRVEDPLSQVGLEPIAPPGAVIELPLSDYHLRHKVRCAFCLARMPHNKGFLVRLSDGSICLCGICCGERTFGKGAWGRVKRDMDRRQARVRYEALLAPLEDVLRTTACNMAALKTAVDTLKAFRMELARKLPDLNGALQNAAAKNGGNLLITKRVIDYVAINMSNDDPEHDNRQLPMRMQSQSMGMMAGRELFTGNLAEAFSGCSVMVSRTLNAIVASPTKDEQYKIIFRKADEAKRYLETVVIILAAFDAFLDRHNLVAVAKWATANTSLISQYSLRGSRLVGENSDATWGEGDRTRLDIPVGPFALDPALYPLLRWSQSNYFRAPAADQAA